MSAPPRRPLRVVGWRGDDGHVVAEAAVVIPLLAAVAFALAWGISLAGTALALGDAVRQAGRDVARGVAVGDALAAAQQRAPGAELRVEDVGSGVRVVAAREVTAPGAVLSGLSITIRQSIEVPREWQ